ncbi:Por secretion system C-terminal sorting domain-containing protein [Chitinophaga sp. YR573]|uniref:glycosyl hydrolase family 18 protein n=1 Tax=Chitinophaga sp. YR573 TaxID=1881040 RepID=UPI0008BE7837|nr:glycosyl hydrolase family 18 protein [Chitinophaga sp. YR573]SEW34399.1 Por secretion system C-terminal sorting domain-containing protein [Chitinophaga sp. YR573]
MTQNLYRKIAFLLLLIAVSLQSSAQFKVIGYLPTWGGTVSNVQFDKLTHINYAFLIPNGTGGYTPPDDPGRLQALVTAAHAKGVKVIISVGGGGGDVGFRTTAVNATYRANFVTSMVNFCNQYNLDGVDLDWEYPSAGAQAQGFVTLMQQLANAFHPQGKLVTAAVIGDYGDDSFLSTLFPIADFLNIMAYDDNDFQHSTYALAVQCLNYWLGRGLPKEKAVLGVPFYAHPDYIAYNDLLKMGADPYADVFNNKYGYNGITTIKAKTNLAYDRGAGIMMWELSNDEGTGANSLVSAIHEVVVARSGDTTTHPSTAPIGKTIWLKGFNGQYVSSEDGDTAGMNCNRAAVQGWEQFSVVDAGNGKVALSNQGLYVSSENGTKTITCNRATIQAWEMFDWITNADGTFSLRGNNGKYVSSENGTKAMTCNRAVAQGWENFNYGIVTASAARLSTVAAKAEPVSVETGKGLLLYPNPVPRGSAITVSIRDYNANAPVQVSMLDVNKKTVVYQKANAKTVTVGTEKLSAGFYILVVKNGSSNYTKKVIIQ